MLPASAPGRPITPAFSAVMPLLNGVVSVERSAAVSDLSRRLVDHSSREGWPLGRAVGVVERAGRLSRNAGEKARKRVGVVEAVAEVTPGQSPEEAGSRRI